MKACYCLLQHYLLFFKRLKITVLLIWGGGMLSSEYYNYPYLIFPQLKLWWNWYHFSRGCLFRFFSGNTNEVLWLETSRIFKRKFGLLFEVDSLSLIKQYVLALSFSIISAVLSFFPLTLSFLLFPFSHNLHILKYPSIKLCLFTSSFQATHVCKQVIDRFSF